MPLNARRLFAFSRPVACLSFAAMWLAGGFFIAAPSAQMQTKNSNAGKKPAATPKKTTAKPTPKTTPKAAQAKATPKTTPKPAAKPSPKQTPRAVAKTTPTPKSTTKPTPKTIVKSTPKPTEQRFIVTASSVNLRENASAAANQTGELRLGTVVRSLERSSGKQTIGGKTDYWHRVAAANDKEGWVFGGFLRQFDPNRRETIYREIAAERAKAAGKNFSGNAELYEFLTRVEPEIKTASIAAEIGMARLVALQNALAAIPFEKQSETTYRNFTEAHKDEIVYSEPSGKWYVRSQLFWDLARKHRSLPIAERIAWTAAQNPLPGECEGYLNCYLYFLKTTHGNYLEQFPRGAHALESLKTIGDMLAPIIADSRKREVYTPPSDVSDRAEFYQTIADLRVIISKTGFIEKDAVVKQLSQIAEDYR